MAVPFGPGDLTGTYTASDDRPPNHPSKTFKIPSFEECPMQDLALYGYVNEPRDMAFEAYIQSQRGMDKSPR